MISIDKLAARLGIWALARLYGRCDPPYEDGCMACEADRMCRHLEELLMDLRTP